MQNSVLQIDKTINQWWWTRRDLSEIEMAEKLAQLFINRVDEFKPHILYGGALTKGSNKPLDHFSFEDVLQTICTRGSTLFVFTNKDRKKRAFFFGFSLYLLKGFSLVEFGVSADYFKSHIEIQNFITEGLKIASLIEPVYGLIHDAEDNMVLTEKSQPLDVFKKIPGAFWGNYFGPEYASKIDLLKLEAAGFKHQKDKTHGGLLILTSDTPFEPDSNHNRKCQKTFFNLLKSSGIPV